MSVIWNGYGKYSTLKHLKIKTSSKSFVVSVFFALSCFFFALRVNNCFIYMINHPNWLTLNEHIGSDLYHQQYRLNKHIGKTLTSLRLYRQFHAFNQTKRAHSSSLYFSDTVTQMTGHTTSESSHTVYLSHYVYYCNSSAYFSAVKATPIL